MKVWTISCVFNGEKRSLPFQFATKEEAEKCFTRVILRRHLGSSIWQVTTPRCESFRMGASLRHKINDRHTWTVVRWQFREYAQAEALFSTFQIEEVEEKMVEAA